MRPYITTKKELEELIRKAIEKVFKDNLPSILRKAKRKEWLTVDELSDYTGWSRRQIYYLKSLEKIPYHQESRRILFKTSRIEDYLRKNMIDPDSDE
ncbi:MAG: helix-turn-helix domain-containing protein [Candidatus Paceibacterota bacterium]